mmetsp:Transcript_142027/g.247409  ORF Transcript_142027/g.247409 Transcript_142027/m.247409 type:complete len:783 (+) Transcript_142027:75-2423(+)
MPAVTLCVNGCGRLPFGAYATCCTRCRGAEGPHAADCAEKCGDRITGAESLATSGGAKTSGFDGSDADEVFALLIDLGVPAVVAESYMPGLLRHGFDSARAFRTITAEDMDRLGIKEGHRRLILANVSSGHAFHKRVRDHDLEGTSTHDDVVDKSSVALAGDMDVGSPAKKRAKKDSAAPRPVPTGSGLPLDGLVVCVSGTMSMIRKQFHEMLRDQGARVVPSVTGSTTHLVTTKCETDSPTRKVLAAITKHVPCVTEQFINDSIAYGAIVDDTPYRLLSPGDTSAPSAWPAGSRSGRGGTSGGAGSSAGSSSAHAAAGAGGLFGGVGRVLGTATAPDSARTPTPACDRDRIVAARGAAPTVTVTSDTASEAAARQVMLAQKWDSKIDPTGWWMSEKLDGVRAYWDGKNFYSRLGNQFPAPDWFKQGLPPTPLDGELWCGRRQFRRCLSIVRNRGSGSLWEYITYLVFDAPACKQPYEQRVAHIKRVVVPTTKPDGAPVAGGSTSSSGACRAGSGCPYAAPVGIVPCEGREHLQRELATVDAKGGEGLMLREPGSSYEHKRSKVLRKVKSVHDEEAKVVGHEGGRGKSFRLGALTLMTPDGRQFSCGTGFSAEDRRSPPAIGSVVTYRFTELMDNGYPRFPVYVGPRIDLDWETICANYTPPSAASHAPGELRRDHSIMFAEKGLARSLSMRAESLPAPARLEDGEAWASAGSEGGDTENEAGLSGDDRSGSAGHAASSSAVGTTAGLARSRSQCLADEAGLDLATARHLLSEHDRASADRS